MSATPKRRAGRPPVLDDAARVPVRLPAPLLGRLDAVVELDQTAASDDARDPASVTRASVIRAAVEEYVRRREDDAREASVPMGDSAPERVRRREAT